MSLLKREKLPMELIKRLADGCDPAYDENSKDLSYDYEELITSMAQHVLELSANLEIVNVLMDAATELNKLAKDNTEKLVAENAALTKTLRSIANAEEFHGDTVVCDFDTLVTIAWSALETLSTDAAIAEMRNEWKAQGVDDFKAWNDSHIEDGDEHEESLREVSKALSIFAATLRAGRKG